MYFMSGLVTSVLDWRNYAESRCLPPVENWQQNWASGCWFAGIVPQVSACCTLLTFSYFNWNFSAFPKVITPFSTFMRLFCVFFSWWSLELALHISRKKLSRVYIVGWIVLWVPPVLGTRSKAKFWGWCGSKSAQG